MQDSSSATGMQMDLRYALRRLAKAVVVITCRDSGARSAMAATAVSELSMDPPSLLICVNQGASIYKQLMQADHFAISILHSSHRAISENCSGVSKGESRFELGEWVSGPHDLPYLRDAQAAVFCAIDQRIGYGTHGIFVGLVEASQTHGSVSPLIYMDGRYVSVGS